MTEVELARDEFLSRMSHELRTPLNAVIGFSRVLESNRAGNQRPEDLELLRRVRASGEQLLRLVEDVLDQSSLRAGMMSVHLSPTNVADVVGRVVDGNRNAAVAKGLKLRSALPCDVTPIQLDATRFAQVVQHLVCNAVKFTGVGSVRVTLAVDSETNRPLRLSVSDTGIGIPAQSIERIFRPFEQVDMTRTRMFGGVGLGLPLAHALCGAMGCELAVTSTVGKGSKFTITFPRS
jgi:two-component system, cell cycle sensor histidine kinase PleC